MEAARPRKADQLKILVFACDRYADAAPAWVYLWRKFWPDCDYGAEFVTNRVRLDVDLPVHYLKGEDMAFGWRLRTFLKKHYTHEHLLIHMVDYYIQRADADAIRQAHQLCARQRIRHVRLRPMPRPPHPHPLPGFGAIDKYANYALSLQPGIWETRVLYDLCRDEENPWVTEMRGSKRVRRVDGLFLSVDHYVLPHLNYYRKGTAQGLDWVRDNVPPEAWPAAVKESYG